MFDLADTKHLHIEFRHEPVRNEARSKNEGRPIFEDREMVFIKFVGDRKKELVAPAREKFMRDRSTGAWLSYAEAFPRHYEAFRQGDSALLEGTPLREAGFLMPAQVKEFEALNLHTVEQLAAIEGAGLQRLGLYGRDHKNKAMQYLENSGEKAMEYRLRQENAELRQRLEALERVMSPPAPAEDQDLAGMSEADLKAFIKEQTGQAPRGQPARETLLRLAQAAANAPAEETA